MASKLLEIHPQELKFNFELKKQSSCLIQLTNKTDHYVAFKVKTTSPKKYCVRPNNGIVKPKSTYDFTVTMQAQLVAPPDLVCKDKFLIQSRVIPFGTTEEDIITTDIFSRESGKHVEDKKLKVFLTSPHSPVLTAINGDLRQDMDLETPSPRDKAWRGVENTPPPQKLAEDVMGSETAKNADELRTTKDVQHFKTFIDGRKELTAASCLQSNQAEDVQELKSEKITRELKSGDDFEDLNSKISCMDSKLQESSAEDVQERKSEKITRELKLSNDFEDLKSKISSMDSKLKEAEVTIMKLTQERSMATKEKDKLQSELVLKTKSDAGRTIQVGFPFLYVCMVAIICLAIGYLSRLLA